MVEVAEAQVAPVDAGVVLAWADALAASGGAASDAVRVDLVRALEVLKCAAEGASLAVIAAFDASQQADQAAAGVRPERLGRGVAAQIALARRESPHRAKRVLSLARIAPAELPHSYAALRRGLITQWRLTVIAKETVFLSRQHRALIDLELAGDPTAIEAMSDRDTANFCQARAAALDPAAVVQRRRHAESERHVSLRPAPDTMTWFGALLPVAQGVAVYAALTKLADAARSRGDERSRGQVMADALTHAVLAYAGEGAEPTVTVNVTMSDRQLFGTHDGHAHLEGFGPVDAELARELAIGDRVRLRRLYASPRTGELVAMESKSRCFPEGLKQLVKLRDRTCRTPGVTHRSATSTTSDLTISRGPPPMPTDKGSANRATMPSKPTVGPSESATRPAVTPSRPSRPPGTPIPQRRLTPRLT